MHGMAAHTCSQAPAAAVPGMSPAPSGGGRVWQMSVRNQRCPPVVPATNSHTDLQEDKLIVQCRKLQCTNEYICRTIGQWDSFVQITVDSCQNDIKMTVKCYQNDCEKL